MRPMIEFPDFAVACGEEASDPLVLHDGAVVRVDELAASVHMAHQEARPRGGRAVSASGGGATACRGD